MATEATSRARRRAVLKRRTAPLFRESGERWLLTSGNTELRETGIFTWTLPALSAKPHGKTFVTCPSAGVCASLCYARSGTYQFSNVKAAHLRNLEMVLDDLDGWKWQIIDELRHRRYKGSKVRVHDAGDFFSDAYLDAWLFVAWCNPDTFFYAYTKRVSLVKSRAMPPNFVIIFSMGGKEDHLIDRDADRHSDVFPSVEALETAGYTNQEDDDLLAATLPTTRIGIVANNIPHLRRKQGEGTFATLQSEKRERRLSAVAVTIKGAA